MTYPTAADIRDDIKVSSKPYFERLFIAIRQMLATSDVSNRYNRFHGHLTNELLIRFRKTGPCP